MNNTPLISIVVPVFNVEKYLPKCIYSILAQTYTNFELLLIDDGSPDNSGKICDEYAAQDSRIKVFHKGNGGASSARNMGLDNANGEWVTFIDSDDWVENNHLQTFYDQIKLDVDLGINSFIADLKYGSRNIILHECFTANKSESINLFFGKLQLHSQFLWNKIFRNSILHKYKIRFNIEVNLGEDNIFILEYLKHINTLSSVAILTYHYNQVDENPNSLGRRVRSKKEFKIQFNANCNAMLSLYNICKEPFILHHASNYYFTRIFERIIIREQYIDLNNQIEYIELFPELNIQLVKHPIIRRYWYAANNRNYIYCLLILNIYKLKLWLTSLTIAIVAAVRRVFKFAPSRV